MVESTKTVLIIEDDADLSQSIAQAIQEAGFSSIVATSARDGMFRLKNQKYVCVILDLKLGQENGEEVVTFMRTRKELENFTTPILVASGNISPEAAKNLAGKINGAVVKPFEVATIVERVTKLIGPA